jgi:triosephosphate isomerase
MRLPVIGANWKLHKDAAETESFFESFRSLVKDFGYCEIVICPSFLAIPTAVSASEQTTIHIGAQNLYCETEGAFTGEVSGPMIKASGCSHVIVGHSERRRYFGETDASVLKKTVAALHAGLIPIVCIGEREKKDVEAVLKQQFSNGIAPLSAERFANIIIAYEPIWAIGAGETATPEVAATAHRLIRGHVKERFGVQAANKVRVIYGGSVKPDNAESLIAQTEIDGFLVGGASLDPVSFAALVNLRKSTEEFQAGLGKVQTISRTAVGLFENASVADQVVHDLGANSFPSNDVRVLQEPLDMPVTGVMSIPHTDFQVRLERELKAIGASTPEADAYAQGVRHGGVLVFATGSNEEVDSASEIMNRHGAIEVEELTGNAPNLAGVIGSGAPLAYTGSTTQTGRSRQSGGGARMFVW